MAKTEAPTETRAQIHLCRSASAVTADTGGPVVGYAVAIVVKTGGDVVRHRREGAEDRTQAEALHERRAYHPKQTMPNVIRRWSSLRPKVEIVSRQAERTVSFVHGTTEQIVDAAEDPFLRILEVYSEAQQVRK